MGQAGQVPRRVLLTGLALLGGAVACGGPEREEGRMAERLTYGRHPSQWADLYRPDGAARGVVVVVHGGFWRARYDASLGRPLAEDLAARGWSALNVEYRRVGNGGGYPETFDDAAAAIDLLAGAGLDSGPVVALGHSAGGHLATWAAARGRFDRWRGGVGLTHVISQAGVVDLAGAYRADLGDGAVAALMGGGPDRAPYHRTDPSLQLPLEVPVWCVHAPDDPIVPFSQSRDYVAAARRAGGRAELVEVEGGHFKVIEVETSAWASVVAVLDSIA